MVFRRSYIRFTAGASIRPTVQRDGGGMDYGSRMYWFARLRGIIELHCGICPAGRTSATLLVPSPKPNPNPKPYPRLHRLLLCCQFPKQPEP